ncbi:vegetative cell wall protein gp1-like [Camellia sinensis]|uniref:vegetative cell wall protein gp1-like n=1 Tax=Camellia sinensis TaxID=4442 RepID=UPI001036B438|nr:vegetative cell wall protein gp1-like [Camellia sinensis]
MGRKRKPDHPRRMMSDVVRKRTSAAPPSEEASYRPSSEGPLVPPLSDQPPQRPLLVAPPLEEASQRAPLVPPYRPPLVAPQQLSSTQPPRLPLVRPPSVAPPLEEASQRTPSEGPLVPPHRPPSMAPQQLSSTQPLGLPSMRPLSVVPQQLSSRLESSAYEPSADPSTSSQPPSGHVSSLSTSSRRGKGCAKGIREWGTGTKLDIQFDENYCPIRDNVSKLTT